MKRTLWVWPFVLVLSSCTSSRINPSGETANPAPAEAASVQVRPADLSTRQKYVQEHPDLADEIKKAILDQKPAASMTPEQVQLVWGPPATIRHLHAVSGERQEWNYADGRQAMFSLGLLYEWK